MANERLRAALLERGTSVAELAAAVEVDPKTAERWITRGRTPYRKHRYAVAAFLRVDEGYLWPDALSPEQVASASHSEIVTVYPHRWAVPRDAWGRLFAEAAEDIGVLVYSGLFLAEDAGMVRLFADKARAGTRVRILLGDPDAPQVDQLLVNTHVTARPVSGEPTRSAAWCSGRNLRHALIRARLQAVDVAAALDVDPKTVDRWICGRIPYPRHRWAVADLLGTPETDLWPELDQRRRTTGCGILAMYPHRWAVPHAAWRRLFQAAKQEIGILAYSGLFLAEDTGILRVLADRARAGTHVRILLGDPNGPQITDRGAEEGIGADVMAARIRNALTLYRPLRSLEGVELRLHRSPLYASIYRADADVMVNSHIYATPAAQAPVLHFRATKDDGPAAAYLAGFEHVWTTAEPAPDRA